MGQLLRDRRCEPRYGWSPEDISQATLRPGCVVRVVDLSAGGALVQANRPLRPGARLHFQLVLRQRTFGLIARVLRCNVWSLDGPDGVIYRGALQFEVRCDSIRDETNLTVVDVRMDRNDQTSLTLSSSTVQ